MKRYSLLSVIVKLAMYVLVNYLAIYGMGETCICIEQDFANMHVTYTSPIVTS